MPLLWLSFHVTMGCIQRGLCVSVTVCVRACVWIYVWTSEVCWDVSQLLRARLQKCLCCTMLWIRTASGGSALFGTVLNVTSASFQNWEKLFLWFSRGRFSVKEKHLKLSLLMLERLQAHVLAALRLSGPRRCSVTTPNEWSRVL